MGTTQSAVARLETPGTDPRVGTLRRALAAAGQRLELGTAKPSIDETLIRQRLALTPSERLTSFERSYANTRRIALAGKRARGELA
jgi:hypothetical protein